MFNVRARFGLLAFTILVAGCAAPSSSPPAPPVSPVVTATPLLIAFKVPACVATFVIAGPAAALQQLAAPNEDGLQPDIRPALDAGIEANCGPPYYVLPH